MGAFATAGFPNAELFAVLAKAAERRIGDFNARDLANTAWAFATAGFLNAELFAVLAKAAERRIWDFNAQNLAAAFWSFSRHASLTVAWSLFEHAKDSGLPFCSASVVGLLSECEPRGLKE